MSSKKQFLNLLQNGWQSSSLKITYTPTVLYEKPICTEGDCINMIRMYWNNETINLQEQVMAFYLNSANKLIRYRLISTGTTSACLIDIKLTVSLALHCMASFVIIAHNHLSGNLKPSQQELQITERVKNALKLIDIGLLDHIIINKMIILQCRGRVIIKTES